MSLPDYDALRPAIRMLLSINPDSAIPAIVAGPLLDQGRACNELGAALAAALLDKDRLIEQEQRADNDPNQDSESVERQTIDELLDLTHHRIDRLSKLYADTAAQYAVDAIEAASQATRRQPLTPSAPRPITATDLILLAEIYLPLIQMPIDDVTDPKRQHRARVENDALADTHRLLTAVIAETKPEDGPTETSPTRHYFFEPELGAVLHDYACACAVLLPLLTTHRPLT